MPQIKLATMDDEANVVDLLTLAFSADPAARWIYPDPPRYCRHFPSFVREFGGQAVAAGSAHYVDAYAGAALWLPPGILPDEERMTQLLETTVPQRLLQQGFDLFEQMGHYHPGEPHWYLPLIGVDPCQQGKGYGAALLEYALVSCDRDRSLAYLESTSRQSVRLYERHGFRLLGTIQVGSSPPLFPMIREPQ